MLFTNLRRLLASIPMASGSFVFRCSTPRRGTRCVNGQNATRFEPTRVVSRHRNPTPLQQSCTDLSALLSHVAALFARDDKQRTSMLSLMKHYLLFYDVVDNYVARRAPFRNEHLKFAWAAVARGELVLGGAFADPVDGAVLFFRGPSPAVATDFAKADPYVLNGLITQWRVREWNTVAGEDAANPVRA